MDWKEKLSALRPNLDEPAEEANNISEPVKPDKLQSGILKVFTDRKGRNGKTATIIEGFDCPYDKLAEIAAGLKKKLGTGGSVRENEILIQGDRKNEVIEYLASIGLKGKSAN